MKTAGDIIAANRQEVWSIPSRATVFEALKLMSDKNVGALPVRDKDHNVVGIVSERDYARKVTLLGKTSRETPIEAIMTPAAQMVTVPPDATLETCMGLMTAHHVRHLPHRWARNIGLQNHILHYSHSRRSQADYYHAHPQKANEVKPPGSRFYTRRQQLPLQMG